MILSHQTVRTTTNIQVANLGNEVASVNKISIK